MTSAPSISTRPAMQNEQTPAAGPLTAESVKLLKHGDWLLCEFGKDRFGVTRSAFQYSHTTIGDVIHGLDGRTCVNLGRCTFLGRPDQDGWIAWHGGENPVPGLQIDWRNEAGCSETWLSDEVAGFGKPLNGNHRIIAYRPHVASPASSSSVVMGDASGVEREDPSESLHKAISRFRKHVVAMSDGKKAIKAGKPAPDPSPIAAMFSDLLAMLREFEAAAFDVEAAFEECEDRLDAAEAQLTKAKEGLPDLSSVIAWLDNGCDPKHAADELRIYKARIDAALQQAGEVG